MSVQVTLRSSDYRREHRRAPAVFTTVYDNAGNVVNTIDGLGHTQTLVYDGLQQQTAQIDALGGITTYLYNAQGQRTGLIDPVGNRTTFVYDGLNRLVEEIDPLGHSLTLAYDNANRLTSQTDRLGRRRNYAYDASGRLLTETWKNSDGSTANVLTHTYDANGNELTAQDSHGVYTLVYDDANQVTSVQELFGLTLTMTYDAVGNRTRVQDSLGGVTTSVYNAVQALTQRTFGGVSQTPLRVDENYNARNQVTTLTRYSDLAGTTKVGEQLTSYDSAGRTTRINQRDGSGTSLINLTYTYDSVGRVSSEVRNGSTTTYLYDATNQLTDDGVASYSYDANGNRTMTGYQTGPGNQLTNDGVYTYTYDNEGNLSKKSKGIADETWTFSYDQRNQLVGVDERATDGGTLLMRATYTYDVFGNRIQKDVWDGSTTTTTRYPVDGWKHPVDGFNQPYALKGLENFDVWAELDGSNALTMRRLFGDGIDQPLARIDSAGTASWYQQDRLGSVVGITDNSGTLIDRIAYDGFLNVTSESNPANGDDIRGTGRLRDAETGLQRHGARMYDPWTGRWIEQDPDRFGAGDANLMRYVGNNPTNATDPSGLWTWSLDAKGRIQATSERDDTLDGLTQVGYGKEKTLAMAKALKTDVKTKLKKGRIVDVTDSLPPIVGELLQRQQRTPITPEVRRIFASAGYNKLPNPGAKTIGDSGIDLIIGKADDEKGRYWAPPGDSGIFGYGNCWGFVGVVLGRKLPSKVEPYDYVLHPITGEKYFSKGEGFKPGLFITKQGMGHPRTWAIEAPKEGLYEVLTKGRKQTKEAKLGDVALFLQKGLITHAAIVLGQSHEGEIFIVQKNLPGAPYAIAPLSRCGVTLVDTIVELWR